MKSLLVIHAYVLHAAFYFQDCHGKEVNRLSRVHRAQKVQQKRPPVQPGPGVRCSVQHVRPGAHCQETVWLPHNSGGAQLSPSHICAAFCSRAVTTVGSPLFATVSFCSWRVGLSQTRRASRNSCPSCQPCWKNLTPMEPAHYQSVRFCLLFNLQTMTSAWSCDLYGTISC